MRASGESAGLTRYEFSPRFLKAAQGELCRSIREMRNYEGYRYRIDGC